MSFKQFHVIAKLERQVVRWSVKTTARNRAMNIKSLPPLFHSSSRISVLNHISSSCVSMKQWKIKSIENAQKISR